MYRKTHKKLKQRIVSDEIFTSEVIAQKHADAWRNEVAAKYTKPQLKISHSLRANNHVSKTYINNLLAEFAPLYVAKYLERYKHKDNILGVEVRRQDMRGCLSITLFNDKHCVPHQRHFLNQSECIAFMQGFMFAERGC